MVHEDFVDILPALKDGEDVKLAVIIAFTDGVTKADLLDWLGINGKCFFDSLITRNSH